MEVIVRRLLEAARAKCGAPPQAVFVKSAKVIRQALTAADDLSPASRRALADETNELTPAVERYYDVLVRMVCAGVWREVDGGTVKLRVHLLRPPGEPPGSPVVHRVPHYAARGTVSRRHCASTRSKQAVHLTQPTISVLGNDSSLPRGCAARQKKDNLEQERFSCCRRCPGNGEIHHIGVAIGYRSGPPSSRPPGWLP